MLIYGLPYSVYSSDSTHGHKEFSLRKITTNSLMLPNPKNAAKIATFDKTLLSKNSPIFWFLGHL